LRKKSAEVLLMQVGRRMVVAGTFGHGNRAGERVAVA
jgi:hypothetical protein